MTVSARHFLTTLLACLLLTWVADVPAFAQTAGEEGVAAPKAGDSRGRRRKRRSQLTGELARQGEAELQKSVRVFQQRYLVKRHRLELLAGGGLELADPLVHHYATDVTLLFHIDERWAVGVSGAKWWGSALDAFHAVQDDFGLFPERSFMQAGGFAEVQFSPIFGKFASFGLAVVQMDAYLLAGGGALRTSVGTDIKVAGMFGFGLRLHTLRAVTISLEIRDMLFNETFQARDELLQHVFAGVKLGLWIPPTFDYRFQR